MKEEKVKKDMLVEDLVVKYPKSVSFLRKYGIVCIQCGEPVWGTIGELIKSKGKDEEKIIKELNRFLEENEETSS